MASALRLTVLVAVCLGLLAGSASAAGEPARPAAPSLEQVRDALHTPPSGKPRDAAETRLPRAAVKRARAYIRKARHGRQGRPMTRAGITWTYLYTFPGASGFSWVTKAYYAVVSDTIWYRLDGFYCPTAYWAQCSFNEMRFVVTNMSGRVIGRYVWSNGRLIPV